MSNSGTTAYPGALDSFDPIGTATYEDDDGYDQVTIHNQVQYAVESIESTLGTNSGTSVLKDFTAGKFAVYTPGGTSSSQTLTSPIINGTITGNCELPIYDYEGKKYAIVNPYNSGGTLSLKGQLHCHSNAVEGLDTPTALVTAYKDADYDFITITDHDTITADPEVAGITWLGASVEEGTYRNLVAYNVATQSTSLNTQSAINTHNNNGKMTSLAHPNLASNIIDKQEVCGLYNFNFIEVYNDISSAYSEDIWDYALSSGKRVFGVAVDDCHDIGGSNFNKAWVVVHTNTNSAAALLTSLREGNFYASTGNNISISISGNTLTATSTGSSNFIFYGRNERSLKTENGVTTSSYTIIGDEMYVRVKSTLVSDSTIAWSQPVFIDIISDDEEELAKIRLLSNNMNLLPRVINGNFDIWQRATTLADGDTSGVFVADRWYISISNTGTLPTNVAHSQQSLTPGDIPGSFYHYRIAPDGAGADFGENDVYQLSQRIEHGVRFLCGKGKMITVSFWARSSIADKKMGVVAFQDYGSGGTPTSAEVIAGEAWTLTTTWKRYSHTFETNTLVGKTFGTANDDKFGIQFGVMWGATRGSSNGWGAAETFVGSGNIDLAAVQIDPGTEALPFRPIDPGKEKLACLRYCYVINTSSTVQRLGMGSAASTTAVPVLLSLPVPLRTTPALTATATDWQLTDLATPTDLSAIALSSASCISGQALITCTVDSGLTQFRPYYLIGDGTANRILILDAEFT